MFHQQGEWVIRVPQGIENRATNLGEKSPKRGIAGQVGTHDHRVHAVANERAKRRPVAARHGGPHPDIFLATVAMQQDLQRRQQNHVERHALALCQRMERLCQRA